MKWNQKLWVVIKRMLDVMGIKVRKVEHSITEEVKEGTQASTEIGSNLIVAAGLSGSSSAARSETLKTEYATVDLDNDTEFLSFLSDNANGRFFVFDNFHYLSTTVQKEFCSQLKEFNYHGIKVIIVGVWKESSRITAMAPDLVNRCEHIDIGFWREDELNKVVEKGEKALNIKIIDEDRHMFNSCCANNIGKSAVSDQVYSYYKDSLRHEL